MKLAKAVYSISDQLPKSEQYGLKLQLRRSAVSIPSNIAEGFYRSSRKDYAHFLTIAKGSLMELETQLELSTELNFLSSEVFMTIDVEIREIDRMITTIRSKLTR